MALVADFRQAMDADRRASRGPKVPLRDALAKTVATYNKLTTNKGHKVNHQRKAIIYNLLLRLLRLVFLVFGLDVRKVAFSECTLKRVEIILI